MVSCYYEPYQETEIEYTGKPGYEGGQCVLPERTCYCYPKCFCDGWDLKCKPMPKTKQEINDDSSDQNDENNDNDDFSND